MAYETTEIHVIVEDISSQNKWYKHILDGMYKEFKKTEKFVICTKKELFQLSAGSIVILVGGSLPFLEEHVNLCAQLSLHPILAGVELHQPNIEASYVTIDRSLAMHDIVKTLISFGARHIALLGVNPAIHPDLLRYAGWYSAVTSFQVGDPDQDVYYTNHGIQECMENFWNNVHKYDAVACTDDYYAIYLLAHASAHHISIPDDLMVTGFGNTDISQYSNPPLTTVFTNYISIGIQAIVLYRLLSSQTSLHSCTEILKADIICRGSTKNNPISVFPKDIVHLKKTSCTLDPNFEDYFLKLYQAENAINKIDESDKKLLFGLLENIPYGTLAENLFLSDTAFKYRLNKLFAATHCKNKAELVQFFRQYIPLFPGSQT